MYNNSNQKSPVPHTGNSNQGVPLMTEPCVTDAVYARLGAILAEKGTDGMLRVGVLGGGCSGFQYSFELASASEEDDMVLERDGVRVLVDPVSLPFLEGATIDYRDELIGARFMVDNPNVRSTCGCGTSFSV